MKCETTLQRCSSFFNFSSQLVRANYEKRCFSGTNITQCVFVAWLVRAESSRLMNYNYLRAPSVECVFFSFFITQHVLVLLTSAVCLQATACFLSSTKVCRSFRDARRCHAEMCKQVFASHVLLPRPRCERRSPPADCRERWQQIRRRQSLPPASCVSCCRRLMGRGFQGRKVFLEKRSCHWTIGVWLASFRNESPDRRTVDPSINLLGLSYSEHLMMLPSCYP